MFFDIANGCEAIEVHRPRNQVHVVASKSKMIEQELLQIIWTFVAYLESHGRSIAACFQLAFQCMYQVIDLFIIDVKIAVARDSNW